MEATCTLPADAREAFAAVLERHRALMRRIAYAYGRDRSEREDIEQEIATQLWRAWPRYDPTRSVTTWMFRIALNVAISGLRRRDPPSHTAVPFDETRHELGAAPLADPDAAEQLRLLHRVIDLLGPLDRALLVLYLEDRSTREMADVLGISETNVTTKIGRLKQRLRERIADPESR